MRLGNRRLICFRSNRISKRKFSVTLFIIIFLLIAMSIGFFFLKTIRPVMIELATAKAQNIAVRSINNAVVDVFAKNQTTYEDIVTLIKDNEGNIKAAQSNLMGVNKLKSIITMAIQDNIANISMTNISIPLGTVTGTDIFAGLGPFIDLKLMPYGMTDIQFVSQFHDTGINQTRLVIDLKVKTDVALLMPTVRVKSTVETTVPVVQTIIVGEVPGSFTHVDRDGFQFEDDVLQLAE